MTATERTFLRNDSEETLAKVLRKEPDLDDWGLADDHLRKRNGGTNERRPIYPEEFEICVVWLESCSLRKTINPRIGSSYGLKHRVEAWSGRYVSNGAFIAAAIHLRIPFKRYPDSPNVHLPLSSQSIPLLNVHWV